MEPEMSATYIIVAVVIGVGIPMLGAAIMAGRLIERLDSIKELFQSALAHWEHVEGKQDERIDDHEGRLRRLEGTEE